MDLRKLVVLLVWVLMVSAGVGAYVHYTTKATVTVFESNISVSPSSFSVSIAKDTEYVKQITVRNYGGSVGVYFDDVVEGPDPKSISVSFKTENGESIQSGEKLTLPEGSRENPSNTTVNVHIKATKDALEGIYTVYIFVVST